MPKGPSDLLVAAAAAGAQDGAKATLTVLTLAGAVLGQLTVTYEADVTGDVVQIYGRQLDVACSTMLGQSSVVTAARLDTLLTGAIFDDVGSSSSSSLPHSLPPRAFELLFDSAKYVASGNYIHTACFGKEKSFRRKYL